MSFVTFTLISSSSLSNTFFRKQRKPKSEWSPERICIVDMRTAVRILVPPPHVSVKALPRWGSREMAELSLGVQVLVTVCTKTSSYCYFLFQHVYSLKLLIYRLAHSSPSAVSNKHAEFPLSVQAFLYLIPTFFYVCLAFFHSSSLSVPSQHSMTQATQTVFCQL